jgi:ClpP class serine protease
MSTRSTTPLRHWARVYNSPLLIQPSALEAMLPGLEAALRELRDEHLDPEAFATLAQARSEQTGLRMEGSVAVLPIYGPLVHRGRYDAECNRLLGYQDIANAFQAAAADPSVTDIVAIYDSPGGEVAGCFDTVDLIARIAAQKPVHAAIAECACSAAYALASASTSICISQTAVAGSIGVYCRHVSMEAWLKNEGYKVSEFFAGTRKADGTPVKDLPADVAARIQGRIDTLYAMFVDLVAANLNVDPALIVAQQSDVFMGNEALSAGLAQRIETPDHLIARLAQAGRDPLGAFLTPSHSTRQEAPTMSAAIPESIATALGVAPDASDAVALAAIAHLTADAALAERTRIFAILEHPLALDHQPQAIALAKLPTMDAKTAGDVLATMPAPQTIQATADNQFASMMTRLGNPDVGADSNSGESTDEAELKAGREAWSRALAPAETR